LRDITAGTVWNLFLLCVDRDAFAETIAKSPQQASPPKTNLACKTKDRLPSQLPASFDRGVFARSSGESFAAKLSLNMKPSAGVIKAISFAGAEAGIFASK
jgi:hypothetical protein